MHMDELFALPAAADYLDMAPRQLRKLCAQREFAVVRRGRRGEIKIRRSELERWIRANTIPASRTGREG